MNFASLLTIEFELIKKRLASFETDHSLVWQEIGNIYNHQETIRTALDTESIKKSIV
jgi:hypothetical protein